MPAARNSAVRCDTPAIRQISAIAWLGFLALGPGKVEFEINGFGEGLRRQCIRYGDAVGDQPVGGGRVDVEALAGLEGLARVRVRALQDKSGHRVILVRRGRVRGSG